VGWHDYKGKYDPAEFVVPPELEKGKSQRIQCYIQAAHYRLLNIVSRSGHFPFEERNDVIRWCIKFGLQYLDTLEPASLRSVMSQANIMERHNANQIAEQTFLKWLDNSRNVVQGHIGRGDEGAAKEDVEFYYREVMKMPDEPDRALRWKLKYLEALKDNFGRLLPDAERK